jgi:hypothetical protein
MKRSEILSRLGFSVPEIKKKRIIIHSDIKCEADDPFAIMHHLLTPSCEVLGIIAAHFEWRYSMADKFEHPPNLPPELKKQAEQFKAMKGTSMAQSYAEGKKILEIAEIDDVPLFKGSKTELKDDGILPESEGADFIITEAMKDDDKPLFIALQGCLTDLAIAYKKEPRIAGRITAIWIGGGDYPDGGDEANIKEDLLAARIIFDSPIKLWQIPISAYRAMEISLSELLHKVKPCGKIGAYLCEEMLAVNEFYGKVPMRIPFPHGESWVIGDNPTVSVLLQGERRVCWHTEKAPFINDDYTYTPNPAGKEIRVYDSIDTRLTADDLFAKLALCYMESKE